MFFTHLRLQWGHQGSISPTFYEQLLHTQIPKAQKKTVNSSSFYESDPRALGSIFQQSIGAKSPMGQASSTWHVLFSQKFALKFHYIIECYFCKIVPFFVLMLGTKKSSKKCQKLLIKFGWNWPLKAKELLITRGWLPFWTFAII